MSTGREVPTTWSSSGSGAWPRPPSTAGFPPCAPWSAWPDSASWTLELPGEKLERRRDTRDPGLGGMRQLLGALEEGRGLLNLPPETIAVLRA
jgi:hypothetical protein